MNIPLLCFVIVVSVPSIVPYLFYMLFDFKEFEFNYDGAKQKS